MSELSTGYPILLNLTDKQIVVVGGGKVATRKVKNLLGAGARVLVISPDITPEIQHWVDAEQVEWLDTTYQRDMLNSYMPLLVITTTDNTRVNQMVVQDAHRIRAWINVTDSTSGDSDFSNMAVVNHPPLTIALSTNGTSPALLRHLKSEIGSAIGDEYAILADWLGEIRQPLKDEIYVQTDRQNLYQEILESDILALLRQGKQDDAWQAFQQILADGIPQ
jgi:precorrin-2 dehydrogenase / sirohydrochlorin ferrochelatase